MLSDKNIRPFAKRRWRAIGQEKWVRASSESETGAMVLQGGVLQSLRVCDKGRSETTTCRSLPLCTWWTCRLRPRVAHRSSWGNLRPQLLRRKLGVLSAHSASLLSPEPPFHNFIKQLFSSHQHRHTIECQMVPKILVHMFSLLFSGKLFEVLFRGVVEVETRLGIGCLLSSSRRGRHHSHNLTSSY
jgi:hypothetical protein